MLKDIFFGHGLTSLIVNMVAIVPTIVCIYLWIRKPYVHWRSQIRNQGYYIQKQIEYVWWGMLKEDADVDGFHAWLRAWSLIIAVVLTIGVIGGQLLAYYFPSPLS